MTEGIQIFVLATLACLFVVLPVALTDEECPSKDDVAPCDCVTQYGQVVIKCHAIDTEQLAKLAANLRGREVGCLNVNNSKLGAIPHDVFEGVKLTRFELEKSTLVALTDRSEAFVGLEDNLRELTIINCVIKNEWDWTVLRNLRGLKLLGIWNSVHLKAIGTYLMKISIRNVEILYIMGSNTSVVYDRAFDWFKNMKSLALSENKIVNLTRSMLPNPALELKSINVSHNQIQHLPEDMFSNMPSLQYVFIDSNIIIFLDEKTFSPIWEQLEGFTITGNYLLCDCRVSWLLEKKYPDTFLGKCHGPDEVKGKKLFKLESKDLRCLGGK